MITRKLTEVMEKLFFAEASKIEALAAEATKLLRAGEVFPREDGRMTASPFIRVNFNGELDDEEKLTGFWWLSASCYRSACESAGVYADLKKLEKLISRRGFKVLDVSENGGGGEQIYDYRIISRKMLKLFRENF